MPRSHSSVLRSPLRPVAMSCYSAAACAALGALFGLVSSHFPAMGFLVVAGFYSIMGLIDQFLISPSHHSQAVVQMGASTSGAENLVAEAIDAKSRARELTSSTTH